MRLEAQFALVEPACFFLLPHLHLPSFLRARLGRLLQDSHWASLRAPPRPNVQGSVEVVHARDSQGWHGADLHSDRVGGSAINLEAGENDEHEATLRYGFPSLLDPWCVPAKRNLRARAHPKENDAPVKILLRAAVLAIADGGKHASNAVDGTCMSAIWS